MSKHKRSTFSGRLGFVLSAAGASVGLGNIWRFPYLAAKYGGGIFLLIYIILALTFGYTMIMAETSLGRMTKKSPVGAYHSFGKSKWLSLGGWINAIIPILIVPYYSVIGGWVIKYLMGYFSGQAQTLASDTYFSAFISNGVSTEICFIVFTFCTLGIIYAGVQNGIERVSKFMMPVLVILSVIIAIYSVTRPGALEGVKYFLVPNLANFSWMTVVSAMGQMFYSLSIAMGILVTFGSYMLKDMSIEDSTQNVEIFDTAIAIMAGLMIIPAVKTLSCVGWGLYPGKYGNFPFISSACGKSDPGPFRQFCMADGGCVDLIRSYRCDPWDDSGGKKGKSHRPCDLRLCTGYSQYTGLLGGSGASYGVCSVVKSPSRRFKRSHRRRCSHRFYSRPHPSWYIAGSGFKSYRHFQYHPPYQGENDPGYGK